MYQNLLYLGNLQVETGGLLWQQPSYSSGVALNGSWIDVVSSRFLLRQSICYGCVQLFQQYYTLLEHFPVIPVVCLPDLHPQIRDRCVKKIYQDDHLFNRKFELDHVNLLSNRLAKQRLPGRTQTCELQIVCQEGIRQFYLDLLQSNSQGDGFISQKYHPFLSV